MSLTVWWWMSCLRIGWQPSNCECCLIHKVSTNNNKLIYWNNVKIVCWWDRTFATLMKRVTTSARVFVELAWRISWMTQKLVCNETKSHFKTILIEGVITWFLTWLKRRVMAQIWGASFNLSLVTHPHPLSSSGVIWQNVGQSKRVSWRWNKKSMVRNTTYEITILIKLVTLKFIINLELDLTNRIPKHTHTHTLSAATHKYPLTAYSSGATRSISKTTASKLFGLFPLSTAFSF